MMKKLLLTLIACASAGLLMAQVNVTTAGVPVTEDFNTLASSGATSSVFPAGWSFTKSNANTTYGIGDGASNSGNLYSYGTTASTERAIGSVASGSVSLIRYGASYKNMTGQPVTSVTVEFTGEQWRRAARTSRDSSIFSYGINNADISSGTWTIENSLSLYSIQLGGTAGAIDGNNGLNQASFSKTITVTVAPGETFNLRWTDTDFTGSDDGLAVDSFMITFNGGTTPPPAVDPVTNLTFSDVQTTSVKLSFAHTNYVDSTYTTLVFLKQDAAVTQGTPTGDVSIYTGNSDFGLATSTYQHDASAKCMLNGDQDSVIITNLVPGKTYHALVYVVNTADSTFSAAATQSVMSIDTAQPPPAPEYMPYNIGQINGTNSTSGAPDSLGVKVMVKGIAVGFNQRTGTGLQFLLVDATGGTTLFNSAKNFGYTVTEGDSIYVKGIVATFRGLHEINIDTLWKGAATTTNLTPTVVAGLNEASENKLIKINKVRFATTPAGTTWAAASTNYPLVTPAGDTITLRLLSTSALAGQPFPATPTFDVAGIGTQFSTSSAAPFLFNGYQVYPRKAADIIEVPVERPVTIGSINTVNPTTGVPDSLGSHVFVRGVVVGFNQRTTGTGLQVTIMDATGGTTLFNASKNFGYTVTEGDSIYAKGVVATFRGLHEINIDTLWKGVQAPFAITPATVAVLNESSESRLIKINQVRFATAPAGTDWASTSTNYPLVTPAGDTITLRLLSTSALAGQLLPTGPTFDVTGIGTQFSTSSAAPFAFNGYQVYPRRASDIFEDTTGAEPMDSIGPFDVILPLNNTLITIDSPYTTTAVTFTWNKPMVSGMMQEVWYAIEIDSIGGNFDSIYFEAGTTGDANDTSLVLTELFLKNKFDQMGMVTGQTFYGKWRVSAFNDNAFNFSNQIRNISFDYKASPTTGLKDIAFENRLSVYPNPASGSVSIRHTESLDKAELFDQLGRRVSVTDLMGMNNASINITGLPAGLYFITIFGTDGNAATRKLVVR